MKSWCAGLFIGAGLLALTGPLSADETLPEAELNNLDAPQALALANQWRSDGKEVKSYVTAREVVFKFPDGTVKRIPLPQDRMVVAIAPYIHRTHT